MDAGICQLWLRSSSSIFKLHVGKNHDKDMMQIENRKQIVMFQRKTMILILKKL